MFGQNVALLKNRVGALGYFPCTPVYGLGRWQSFALVGIYAANAIPKAGP